MSTITISPGLGNVPPTPNVPPKTIFASSTAEDVKLWVYYFIIQQQPYLDHQDAWSLAKKVKGNGKFALIYNKEDWEKEVPGWGTLIYYALHETPKYVVSKIRNFQILILIIRRSIQSSTFSWLYKPVFSSWQEVLEPLRLLRKPISKPLKLSASSSSLTLSRSGSYKQSSLALGLINGRDIQTPLSSDVHGIASGKISQAYLSEGQHGSRNRPVFHRDTD